jgi:hypothetical protein
MCTEHLNDGPLVCTRTDPHVTGHTYESAWAPDPKHADVTEDDQ